MPQYPFIKTELQMSVQSATPKKSTLGFCKKILFPNDCVRSPIENRSNQNNWRILVDRQSFTIKYKKLDNFKIFYF